MLLQVLALIFLAAVLASIWWYAWMPANLPPGPIGLPFVGSMFDTWKASNLHVKLHAWTKIYGPLYKLHVADKLVLILGDWDTIQEALVKQGDAFAGRSYIHIVNRDDFKPGLGLTQAEGEIWKTQRRFALSTLRDFGFGRPIIEPRIKDEAEYLIESIETENGRPFDPGARLNNAVSNVICALVYGRRFEYDDEKFKFLMRMMRISLSENDISFLTPFVLSKSMARLLSILPQVKRLMNQGSNVANFAKEHIKECMKNFDVNQDEPTNYVQAFYKAQREREENWTFTDDQLLVSVSNLFIAGTDTTATTLRWAIFYMAHHSDWQEKVYQEIKKETGGQSLLNYADRNKLPITEATIMEIQRSANLVPLGVLHRTLVETKLCGYDIPADTVVVPLLTGVFRDEKVYPNPDRFDPTRFLNGHKDGGKAAQIEYLIPFSAGKRSCLGESLARMELFLFFTALISKFRFNFSSDEPVPPMDGEKVSFIRGTPVYKVCATRREE